MKRSEGGLLPARVRVAVFITGAVAERLGPVLPAAAQTEDGIVSGIERLFSYIPAWCPELKEN